MIVAFVSIIRLLSDLTRPLQENIWDTAATADGAKFLVDDMKGTAIAIIAPTAIATKSGATRTVVTIGTVRVGAMTATAVARAQNTHLDVVTPVVLAHVNAGARHPAATLIQSGEEKNTYGRYRCKEEKMKMMVKEQDLGLASVKIKALIDTLNPSSNFLLQGQDDDEEPRRLFVFLKYSIPQFFYACRSST
jgi:hypothetical protein